MKLSDLKQGMQCEMRNGDILVISNDGLYNDLWSRHKSELNKDFNDDFTHKRNKSFDIVKVIYYTDLYTSGGIYYNKSRV